MAPSLPQEIKSICDNNSYDDVRDALEIALSLVENIHENPMEPKYRKVRVSNPNVAKITNLFGGKDLMTRLMGWTEVQLPDKTNTMLESYLMYNEHNQDVTERCITLLKDAIYNLPSLTADSNLAVAGSVLPAAEEQAVPIEAILVDNEGDDDLYLDEAAYEAKARKGKQLLDACSAGRLARAEALLKEGAPVNFKDDEGYTPLHAACGSFEDSVLNTGLVEVLLKYRANVNATADTKLGATPLHWAVVANKSRDVVHRLIQHRADVNALDRSQASPLHWAAWTDNVDVVQLLVESGADTELKHAKGLTALQIACLEGNAGVAWLLSKQSDIGPSLQREITRILLKYALAPKQSARQPQAATVAAALAVAAAARAAEQETKQRGTKRTAEEAGIPLAALRRKGAPFEDGPSIVAPSAGLQDGLVLQRNYTSPPEKEQHRAKWNENLYNLLQRRRTQAQQDPQSIVYTSSNNLYRSDASNQTSAARTTIITPVVERVKHEPLQASRPHPLSVVGSKPTPSSVLSQVLPSSVSRWANR